MESFCIRTHIQVVDNVLHDFAKGKGHDGQIVATQTQDWNTDQKTHNTRHQTAGKHGNSQPQNGIGDHGSRHRGHNDTGKRTDTHKARMTKAQFAADTHQQVQADRQNHISADGNQITLHGAAQSAKRIQGLHNGKGNDHQKVGRRIGALVLIH